MINIEKDTLIIDREVLTSTKLMKIIKASYKKHGAQVLFINRCLIKMTRKYPIFETKSNQPTNILGKIIFKIKKQKLKTTLNGVEYKRIDLWYNKILPYNNKDLLPPTKYLKENN